MKTLLICVLFLFSLTSNAQDDSGRTYTPKKTYKKTGKNFSEGIVTLADGNQLKGWVAFEKQIWNEYGDIYGNTFFKEKEDGNSRYIEKSDIASVQKKEGDVLAIYSKFDRGFISIQQIKSAKFSNIKKSYGAGTLWLKSGESIKGFVAQKRASDQPGVLGIYAIDEDNNIYEYSIAEVKSFTQTYKNAEHGFAIYDGKVEEMETVAELAKKKQKLPGKNFTEGKVMLKDGTTLDGWLAFDKKSYNRYGRTYSELLFAKNKESFAALIGDNEVSGIDKKEGDKVVQYRSLRGKFISLQILKEVFFNIKNRNFNPGKVTMQSGETFSGEIAQSVVRDGVIYIGAGMADGKFVCDSILFIDEKGNLSEWDAKEVKEFTQTYEEAEHTYIANGEKFGKVAFDGNSFKMYYNTAPTNINENATKKAKAGTRTVGGGLDKMMLVGDIYGEAYWDANEKGKKIMRQSVEPVLDDVRDKSLEELEQARDKILDGKTSSQYLNQGLPAKETLRYKVINREIIRRENAAAQVVYYKEWIIQDKKNNTSSIVWKQGYKTQILELLNSCDKYSSLDEDTKKSYRKWENRKKAMAFIDSCN
jgi:hypothetical protein